VETILSGTAPPPHVTEQSGAITKRPKTRVMIDCGLPLQCWAVTHVSADVTCAKPTQLLGPTTESQ
jgi:hypothetical protein